MNLRLSVALVALALLGSGTARAEMVDFSYALAVSPQIIHASDGVYATAEYLPSGTAQASTDSSPSRFAKVVWTVVAPPNLSSPVYLSGVADLMLTLTDHDSGRSWQFGFFSANLWGWVGGGNEPLSVFVGQDFSYRQLGEHFYYVSLLTPVQFDGQPKPPPYAEFKVSVTSLPEPSSLALGAVAGLCLAVRRWRRGRNTAVERR